MQDAAALAAVPVSDYAKFGVRALHSPARVTMLQVLLRDDRKKLFQCIAFLRAEQAARQRDQVLITAWACQAHIPAALKPGHQPRPSG